MATENLGKRKLGERSPLVVAASVRNFQQGRLKAAINSLLAIVGELNYSEKYAEDIKERLVNISNAIGNKIDIDWEVQKHKINTGQNNFKFADTCWFNMSRKPIIGEIVSVEYEGMTANYEIVGIKDDGKGIGKLLKS